MSEAQQNLDGPPGRPRPRGDRPDLGLQLGGQQGRARLRRAAHVRRPHHGIGRRVPLPRAHCDSASPLGPPPFRWTVPIGLLQTALFNILATLALSVGGAGRVSVLVYTMSFWLVLLAWPFLGERLRGLQWPAWELAFAGLVLVVRPWDIGDALGGVLAVAAGTLLGGRCAPCQADGVPDRDRRARAEPHLGSWPPGAVVLSAIAVLAQSGWPHWTINPCGRRTRRSSPQRCL